MSHRTTRFALPALLAFSTLIAREGTAQGGAPVQPAADRGASVDRAAEAQAIRALSQRWMVAQQKKDVDGVIANYASDVVAVYGGRLLTGPDAIRRAMVDDLAKDAKERPDLVPTWQTTSVEISQAGDLAYETGTWEDTWGGGKNRERGYYLTVWQKVGRDWKVVRDVGAPERKAAEAAKPAP